VRSQSVAPLTHSLEQRCVIEPAIAPDDGFARSIGLQRGEKLVATSAQRGNITSLLPQLSKNNSAALLSSLNDAGFPCRKFSLGGGAGHKLSLRRERTSEPGYHFQVDAVFDLCVRFLVWLAGITGTTYKQINVIVFCVLWPILTLGLIAIVLYQRRAIRALRRGY
jgi:hypothetical protein